MKWLSCNIVRIYIKWPHIFFQDPNEDTEWNDVLRAKGIIPPKEKKEEITEDDIVNMLEQTIEKKLVTTLPNVYVLPLHQRVRP